MSGVAASKGTIKLFSLVLAVVALGVIVTTGAVSTFASANFIYSLLPTFMGQWATWIAWILAGALIMGIQIAECRPLYLRYLHTRAMELHHQGAHPGNASPSVKSLQTQLNEEVGMDRSAYLWAKALAVGMTIFDFIWSCVIFPPFRAGNDLGAIWNDILRYGVGAFDLFNVFMILANVALIPICYLIFLNECHILTSGKKDK
jgi:hypothetical protein